jgi:hypothetical protein
MSCNTGQHIFSKFIATVGSEPFISITYFYGTRYKYNIACHVSYRHIPHEPMQNAVTCGLLKPAAGIRLVDFGVLGVGASS